MVNRRKDLRGERESRLTSVASNSSPVTIPGAYGAGGSSHGSSQQQMPQLRHSGRLETPFPTIFIIDIHVHV